jgi:DNA-binding MarR family transcriptional regulator
MPELTSSEPPKVVPLSGDDARELARLMRILLQNLPTQESDGRGPLVQKARSVFNERKRRSQFLPRHLFDEPGWDMLLALYITDFSGGRQTIGRLISWIGAPQTTALRWISYLEGHRLISREQHPRDRRTVFVGLTDQGRQVLDRYFSSVADSQSPLEELVGNNRHDQTEHHSGR